MLPNATQHLSPVWARYSNVVADHAEGAYIYAEDGSRYLDFTCGIGVTNTGHCHPQVVAAAQAQVGKLIHGQANIVYHRPMLDLVEQLLTVVPPTLDTFFFSNSGAEAIEASVKLARAATGRPNIISFVGGFHGRTNATMALTSSKAAYRSRYAPLASGIHIAPYPYAYRMGMSPEHAARFCLDELAYLLETQTSPDQVAGILIEPVLGEGGYIVPPDGFWQGLQELGSKHGILLIADEVQSGFGRTGKWFGHQHFLDSKGAVVTPDIMVMAKGLASGFPLSAIAARQEIMAKWAPGSHGGTYGGNAVACAAGAATIRALKEDAMVENAAKLGPVLLGGLKDLQEEFPIIGDVRGLGLMAATEFTHPSGDWHESKKIANGVRQKCMQDGKLMLLTCGPYDNVIRWIPPLIVSEQQIGDALGVFKHALKEVVG